MSKYSKYDEVFCWHCGEYTKQKYLGKSRDSYHEIFTFLKWKLWECCKCGKLNKD